MKFENFGTNFLLENDPKLSRKKEIISGQVSREDSNKRERLENDHEKINKFFRVIEQTHQGHRDDPEVISRIKRSYYRKYIIKEGDIPQNYWNLQARIMVERGHGTDMENQGIFSEEVELEDGTTRLDYIFPDNYKEQEFDAIRKDQTHSFNKWFDYLISEDADDYPMWFKYWAFHGFTKLGTYDKQEKRFNQRTSQTVAPFPDLNQEALAAVLHILEQKYDQEYFDLYQAIVELKQDIYKAKVDSANEKRRQSRNKVLQQALEEGYIKEEGDTLVLSQNTPQKVTLVMKDGREVHISKKQLEGMTSQRKKTYDIKGLHEELGALQQELREYLINIGLEDSSLHADVVDEDFGRLYSYAIENITSIEGQELLIVDGDWAHFPKGSNPITYIPEGFEKGLVPSLEGRGTGWCTAGESVAREHLKKGDYYIFYSKNISGDSINPRIAIRMEGNNIAEVRGIAPEQELDAVISGTDTLDEKLEQFGDEANIYRKKSSDMKRLTRLSHIIDAGEELGVDDLRFLYEVDSPIQGFGYEKDPRVDNIISQRKMVADLAQVFDVSPEEIVIGDVFDLSLVTGLEGKIWYGTQIPESGEGSGTEVYVTKESLSLLNGLKATSRVKLSYYSFSDLYEMSKMREEGNFPMIDSLLEQLDLEMKKYEQYFDSEGKAYEELSDKAFLDLYGFDRNSDLSNESERKVHGSHLQNLDTSLPRHMRQDILDSRSPKVELAKLFGVADGEIAIGARDLTEKSKILIVSFDDSRFTASRQRDVSKDLEIVYGSVNLSMTRQANDFGGIKEVFGDFEYSSVFNSKVRKINDKVMIAVINESGRKDWEVLGENWELAYVSGDVRINQDVGEELISKINNVEIGGELDYVEGDGRREAVEVRPIELQD